LPSGKFNPFSSPSTNSCQNSDEHRKKKKEEEEEEEEEEKEGKTTSAWSRKCLSISSPAYL
jgi:ribosomal protein L12E/L44/L45/RPP1/RPP2